MDSVILQALRELAETWVSEKFAHGSFDPDRQPALSITASKKVKKIQAGVSPDCSYRLVSVAMEAAQDEICLYIYNVSADHLLDLLRDAKNRGVRVRLMYDVTDTRGNERQKLSALGVELKEAPSSNGRKVFTVCHQKFAVIDQSVLLLGSANWAKTSIPLVTPPGKFKKGNREWIIRIDDASLAKWFKKLFEADWNIPEVEAPMGLAVEADLRPEATVFPSLLANVPDEVFDIKRVDLQNPVTVTPIISPNNYFDLMKKLIEEAKTSVDIEQQYILSGGPKTEGLLSALKQRKGELEIRIIVSPAFRKEGSKDNWELSVESLEAFNLNDCLRAMNLSYYTHLHNKGVIVDRRKVIVSSTNWSENSIARAREAGVLIESSEIAGYYAEVFDFDWSIAWDPADVPANIAQLFQDAIFVPGGFEEIHPGDLV
ncbi:MAG: phospholipase D-like domain-containing protein [Nitrospiraceae bacterium]|nr:phospholipase D-like domain-containing protein [Nitrospiraceae bacterium]